MHKATIIGGVKMYPPSHRDNELTLKNIIVYEEEENDKVEQSIEETSEEVRA